MADSPFHNYTHNLPTQSVAIPDEERAFAVGASCLDTYACVCVCDLCAKENTALYSRLPDFWRLKGISFSLFFPVCVCIKEKRQEEKNERRARQCPQSDESTNDKKKERKIKTIFFFFFSPKNCLVGQNLRKEQYEKILNLLCVSLSVSACVCVCVCVCICVYF